MYEGALVAEHWLPYSTNLGMNEYSRFSATSWELSNLSPYPFEFIDYGATYYRQYFADHGRCIKRVGTKHGVIVGGLFLMAFDIALE